MRDAHRICTSQEAQGLGGSVHWLNKVRGECLYFVNWKQEFRTDEIYMFGYTLSEICAT
jgi:hypothetical protein